MNMLARSCWIAAPIYALIGMGFGIWMSATGDHSLGPAHGHLNLLGWVSIALFGTYYSLQAKAGRSMLARIQVVLAHLATITMFPGIILAIQGTTAIVAQIASVLGVLTMLLFLVIVIRTGRNNKDNRDNKGSA